MTIWLRNQNFKVNKKCVRRLIKLINWQTIYRETRTTISNKEDKKHPYLLKNLKITVWAIDITYIPIEKWVIYLTVII